MTESSFVRYNSDDMNKGVYMHIAYADNAKGTQGFTTDSNIGVSKEFFGFGSSFSKEDSQNPDDYSWYSTTDYSSDHADAKPEGTDGGRVEPKPNVGKKRIPKWAQYVVVFMVTGAIGLSFAGLATGVVLWFVFDWINGDF